MNKKRRLTAVFLALIMALTSMTALADSAGDGLLLLGDSIATGYGLADKSSESYGALLSAEFGEELINLAKDGAKSGDLLTALKDPAFIDKVAAAETIVVSIGGNDLLGPFLTLAKTALGLEAGAANEKLLAALAAPGAINALAAALTAPENALAYMGYANQFATVNLPAVVGAIKAANPNAALYIQTVYNPFSGVPGMEIISETAEVLFSGMNKAIKAGTEAGYKVIDVNAAFSKKAPLYTNISQMDIHPNAAGHKLIFDLIKKAMPPAESPESPAEPEPITPAFPAWENPFKDLSPDNEYFEAIAFMNQRGIIAGYGNGLVGANDALTRAQFAALLWKLEGGIAPKGTASFNDVAVGAWYYAPVIWAAESGVMGGAGDIFAPDAPIDRQEIAAALHNYATVKGHDLPQGFGIPSSMTRDAVTRGEVAHIFMNLLLLINN